MNRLTTDTTAKNLPGTTAMRCRVGCVLLLLSALVSCSTIDDDLSDCGYEVNYEMKLQTNIQTKLTTQLQTDLALRTNIELTSALRTHLETVFRDHADDVDLSFYDIHGDSVRLEHDQHVMNGSEEQYTLNIPRRHYLHLATANVEQEQSVESMDGENCHTAHMAQTGLDTIPSHTTGLFSARYDMDIKDSIDQTFNVQLYMANAATVLVVDTMGSGVRDIKVYATGFATGFRMADSTYIYSDNAPVMRSTPVSTPDRRYACYSTVSFPSRNVMVIPIGAARHNEPESVADGVWKYFLDITTASGSVTHSVLNSYRPLLAEEVLVMSVKLESNGTPSTTDPMVGVSVTLDWRKGHNQEVPL